MTIQELKQIALHAAKGTAPANFTVDQVNPAFVDGLREFAGSINQFMKNRYDLYDIIIQAADEVVPTKTIDALGIFCEVQNIPQGQRAMFRTRKGRNRAKKFLTQVGLSGVYETFRLDEDTYTVNAHAIGGAASVDFERMLDGVESLAEVMSVITEGLVDATYYEVHKALKASLNSTDRPTKNKYTAASFNATEMEKLLNVVRNYGSGAAIFATNEFVAAMGADAVVAGGSSYQGIYHPDDIDSIHKTGYPMLFRGAPIVRMTNHYQDETNDKTWLDPQMAYILPTGGEKVVKVVFEGATQIYDHVNRDNSMEVHAYKKMGVAIATHHNWAIYQNTGITQTYENPWGFFQ